MNQLQIDRINELISKLPYIFAHPLVRLRNAQTNCALKRLMLVIEAMESTVRTFSTVVIMSCYRFQQATSHDLNDLIDRRSDFGAWIKWLELFQRTISSSSALKKWFGPLSRETKLNELHMTFNRWRRIRNNHAHNPLPVDDGMAEQEFQKLLDSLIAGLNLVSQWKLSTIVGKAGEGQKLVFDKEYRVPKGSELYLEYEEEQVNLYPMFQCVSGRHWRILQFHGFEHNHWIDINGWTLEVSAHCSDSVRLEFGFHQKLDDLQKTIVEVKSNRLADAFIGREIELGAISHAVETSNRLVVVTGEPGIGKSTLAKNLALQIPEFRYCILSPDIFHNLQKDLKKSKRVILDGLDELTPEQRTKIDWNCFDTCILFSRPIHEVEEILEKFDGKSERFILNPLSEENVRLLCQEYLPDHTMMVLDFEEFLEVTGGNPLLIELLCYAILQRQIYPNELRNLTFRNLYRSRFNYAKDRFQEKFVYPLLYLLHSQISKFEWIDLFQIDVSSNCYNYIQEWVRFGSVGMVSLAHETIRQFLSTQQSIIGKMYRSILQRSGNLGYARHLYIYQFQQHFDLSGLPASDFLTHLASCKNNLRPHLAPADLRYIEFLRLQYEIQRGFTPSHILIKRYLVELSDTITKEIHAQVKWIDSDKALASDCIGFACLVSQAYLETSEYRTLEHWNLLYGMALLSYSTTRSISVEELCILLTSWRYQGHDCILFQLVIANSGMKYREMFPGICESLDEIAGLVPFSAGSNEFRSEISIELNEMYVQHGLKYVLEFLNKNPQYCIRAVEECSYSDWPRNRDIFHTIFSHYFDVDAHLEYLKSDPNDHLFDDVLSDKQYLFTNFSPNELNQKVFNLIVELHRRTKGSYIQYLFYEFQNFITQPQDIIDLNKLYVANKIFGGPGSEIVSWVVAKDFSFSLAEAVSQKGPLCPDLASLRFLLAANEDHVSLALKAILSPVLRYSAQPKGVREVVLMILRSFDGILQKYDPLLSFDRRLYEDLSHKGGHQSHNYSYEQMLQDIESQEYHIHFIAIAALEFLPEHDDVVFRILDHLSKIAPFREFIFLSELVHYIENLRPEYQDKLITYFDYAWSRFPEKFKLEEGAYFCLLFTEPWRWKKFMEDEFFRVGLFKKLGIGRSMHQAITKNCRIVTELLAVAKCADNAPHLSENFEYIEVHKCKLDRYRDDRMRKILTKQNVPSDRGFSGGPQVQKIFFQIMRMDAVEIPKYLTKSVLQEVEAGADWDWRMSFSRGYRPSDFFLLDDIYLTSNSDHLVRILLAKWWESINNH